LLAKKTGGGAGSLIGSGFGFSTGTGGLVSLIEFVTVPNPKDDAKTSEARKIDKVLIIVLQCFFRV
jgi:hypothetical protein